MDFKYGKKSLENLDVVTDENGNVVGKIVNCAVEESALRDGMIVEK